MTQAHVSARPSGMAIRKGTGLERTRDYGNLWASSCMFSCFNPTAGTKVQIHVELPSSSLLRAISRCTDGTCQTLELYHIVRSNLTQQNRKTWTLDILFVSTSQIYTTIIEKCLQATNLLFAECVSFEVGRFKSSSYSRRTSHRAMTPIHRRPAKENTFDAVSDWDWRTLLSPASFLGPVPRRRNLGKSSKEASDCQQ
ncbi:uncharacterized protein RSE6_04573 [Rhynchosporium secalis]|uniref:Uncharacterized protein n=1 Tax=Rhynchosporium secalis TaxID=38038 RepID=A0A1E1M5P3_RHYSE|nr:uncharacterized protein RSE6_04573 [Rhynchosporium secalis]